jgi:hypothetical protein
MNAVCAPNQSAPELPASIVSLSAGDARDFGVRTLVSSHDLHRSELFTDAGLIDLLDRFPRGNLYALTTGADPARPDQNQFALSENVSGADLLRAVRKGRLWLNLTRINYADDRYRELLARLYAQLAAQVNGFKPDWIQGNLLISSPHAIVYYHADGPASVLWHMRGRKRVWVYPANDTRYVRADAMEDIFAGVRHEYLPYETSFDDAALVIDLQPGQWISWPQNSPHRVVNLDGLNVSLTTEHFTRQTRRRARVYVANRFLRTRFGMTNLSTRDQGPAAFAKAVMHKAAKLTGFDRAPPKRHVATMRVDAEAPQGVVALAQPDAAGKASA